MTLIANNANSSNNPFYPVRNSTEQKQYNVLQLPTYIQEIIRDLDFQNHVNFRLVNKTWECCVTNIYIDKTNRKMKDIFDVVLKFELVNEVLGEISERVGCDILQYVQKLPLDYKTFDELFKIYCGREQFEVLLRVKKD